MKNVSSLKTNNSNSPKTPGGISKSLLTPCRRVGLSRNWRKNGSSPFISPVSSTSSNIEEEREPRKRKEPLHDDNGEKSPAAALADCSDITITPKNVDIPRRKKSKVLISGNSQEYITASTEISDDRQIKTNIDTTPLRNVDVLRRKKSKTIISGINSSQEETAPHSPISDSDSKELINVDTMQTKKSKVLCNSSARENVNPPLDEESFDVQYCQDSQSLTNNATDDIQEVSTPKRIQSKSKKSMKVNLGENSPEPTNNIIESKESIATIEPNEKNDIIYTVKEKSPNDLKKECVVVIQRRLFENVGNINTASQITSNKSCSVEIIYSDEDTPLINLNKQNVAKNSFATDDDFVDCNKNKTKANKLKTTKSTHIKHKGNAPKSQRDNIVIKEMQINSTIDDDDDFDSKKTILIRKSYDKVSKPTKAKSTGSITQKDIDNLRNRIEAKKKLLLAQSLTPDTEELRTLIKKWQKGCQDALIELLDLMRTKFPDKERMDYSEMLKTLKIPPSLVGYDSDDDCFHSPDDASIILGQFKDL